MALAHTKFKVELREILLKDRPKQLISISQKGTVPVLQLSSEKIIDESLDIMIWSLKTKKSNWINLEYELQIKMINLNDSKFKYWLDRYKYHNRYPESNKLFYQNKCKFYLKNYERKLNKNSSLISTKIQLVDVAIFPFIRQYAHVDLDGFVQSFPKLNQFLRTFEDSSLFKSTMKKYDVWKDGDTKIITNFQN